MKKIVLVVLMALCGASFGFGDSTGDCVRDCTKLSMRKQKALNATKCIEDCQSAAVSEDQQARSRENALSNTQSDVYSNSRQQVNPAPEGPTR